MNALVAWLEKFFLPLASKIGGQKHLIALRDAFIGTLPATMAGSVAVMLNAILRDLPPQFIDGYDGTTIPVIKQIITINGYVWNGTLAIAGLIFVFSWGYNIAKAYGVNELSGGIVSTAASIAGITFSFTGGIKLKGLNLDPATIEAINKAGWAATPKEITATGWGWLPLNNLDANFFFTAMIIGFIATMIYVKLMLKDITIKLPDSVPPAISKAFASIIPATAALYVVAIFYWLFSLMVPDMTFLQWMQKTIAEPLLGLSQGFGAVVLTALFVQLFWFFGIHGPNVLAPILESVFGVAQLQNVNLFQKGGADLVISEGYNWVRGSFDAYAWFGGSGGTLVLILAILLFSKRKDYLTVGKLSVGPGIFNINEPIMFGLPIVLNPIMFIPFLLAPVVSVSIGYFATIWGLVNPVSQQVVWVTPPFLMSFLATGGDWRAPIVTLVAMVVSFLIWVPFVMAANKMDPSLGEEAEK
ncbi:PTS sugar transporter subunit IIC [Caldifermentibacillus hisashii]|jgi:cellobiose PTS system EIIC component|uniref:Permease IIC component n=1 Tax=Caldibacillus thermoamylovorans TaxID=35841 RepID=A0ABD4A1E1_9BACI|nr:MULTISPECIES: PTS sugar transporter subunit IIC [Bacillaceae]KIO69238.1 PTS system, cellobiose-specific IIC component [Caldibacillus thermoamylovorans]KIO70039.1 PTS system, cellobiose-specific IIC component [Caldibacillus thermoamylovorans]MCM3477358.1 PTS sugar transporter subunit IIC [Caldibacillus thermoamylovorans]MEC5270861.1 PTS sugar transporter subunit IIC [Caldifermentibacillus hisashii]PAC34254.1 PTS cellobiose transporter subunit IIC [Caldifermentibacillus hisashii]